jgi:hypothetical protein
MHLDAPYFWGASRVSVPQWLLVSMVFSGLFQDKFVDQVQVSPSAAATPPPCTAPLHRPPAPPPCAAPLHRPPAPPSRAVPPPSAGCRVSSRVD